jgi:N-acetylglucosamine-6-phosphate deacetylase
MQTIAYLADALFTGEDWLNDHAVIVTGGKIDRVIPSSQVSKEMERKRVSHFMAPAFIDVQIYGAHQKLLSVFPHPDTLTAMCSYCRKGGAALFLPTVSTNTPAVFRQSIDAVKTYWQQGGKGVWGLHLEGPWLNKQKRGAHIEEWIHAPEQEEVEELLAFGKGVIKMITVAPEVCTEEIIGLIQSHGIVVSAGHSNATYDEATTAFNRGIGVATHLYNAMSPLQHREPGMVGAIFAHNRVKASIIADGHHVDFTAIKIAKRLMQERLFVITDAVTETSHGPYRHQLVNGRYESGGTLSGSAITMHGSFINLVKKAGIQVEEALRMCSLYPAQVLGAQGQWGKIAPGYAAQFVVLTKQLELVDVITA